MHRSYHQGASAAMADHGINGAERLSKLLMKEPDEGRPGGRRSGIHDRNKPVRWGPTVSLEGSGNLSNNHSGMGQYGGV